MAELKKILITVPEGLLEEVDQIAALENINRSKLVRDAMKLYIRESQKSRIRKQLIEGYKSMAAINSELSSFCIHADNQVLGRLEQRLAESE